MSNGCYGCKENRIFANTIATTQKDKNNLIHFMHPYYYVEQLMNILERIEQIVTEVKKSIAATTLSILRKKTAKFT